jgi:hypothetical protein
VCNITIDDEEKASLRADNVWLVNIMDDSDAFDPVQALNGWRSTPPAPLDLVLRSPLATVVAEPAGFDPTHALDGWRAPTPAPPDLQIRSLRRAALDDAKLARLKARGYEMVDVEDVDEVRPVAVARAPLDLPAVPLTPCLPDDTADPPRPDAARAAPDLRPHNATQAPPMSTTPHPQPALAKMLLPDVPPPAAPQTAPVLDFDATAARPGHAGRRVLEDIHIHLPDVPPPTRVDAPVLDLRMPSPPEAVEPEQLLKTLKLPTVSPPAAGDMPTLDLPAAPARPAPDARLLGCWQPQAWLVLLRRIAEASTSVMHAPEGLRVESYAPQWLCALWPPQPTDAALLGHWPELARVVAADGASEAAQALLADIPTTAELWTAELDADWCLLAELVLGQNPGLRRFQAEALRKLADAERQANRQRITEGYALQDDVVRRRA